MIDKSRPPASKPGPKRKRAALSGFLPVPRHYARHDGWTPERQRGFIEALADTGSVKAAAHAVNMTPEGAYLLRRHPEAASFRKAWEQALKLGVQRLEDVAMDRALNGVETPVYHFGEIIGTRRVYNDRLLMFLLRNRAGKRFSADGLHKADAATRGQVEKLKRQWRKQWEKERALAAAAERQAVGETFVAAIHDRHRRWWDGLSPRARAAYLDFRRIESEDAGHAPAPGDENGENGENGGSEAHPYAETFAGDSRAPIARLVEADGLADEDVLAGDLPADPPQHRLISLKGERWSFIPDDGRVTPL